METKPYSQYKDSKIKWIGKLPYPWKEHKLIYSLKKITDGSHSSVPFIENGYPFVTVKNIDKYTETINFQECKKISKENYNILVRNGCKPNKGDILFSQIGTIGLTIIVKEDIDFVILSSLAILKPQNNIDKKYLKYFLQSNLIKNLCNYFMAGGAVKRITLNHISNFIFFEPPLEEQEHIAKYLDTKTTKIEQTITKNKQLITLLKEKRTTLINQTVTKGLNPDTPMKESGIEWIGKIPEHWSSKRLRFLGLCQNGISKSSEFFGKGYPFISYKNIYDNMIVKNPKNDKIISSKAEQSNYSVKKGDVFFTRTSETIEELGFTSTCLNTIPQSTFAGFLIRFRPFNSAKIIPEFSKYYFRREDIRKFFIKESDLVTRASLSQDVLKNLICLLPPIKEQTEIVDYLDKQTYKIDKTIEKVEKNIELLEEYKESLIHHVVTGKIDVRGVE